MDDCVEHVSEQIALDGAVGTSLDRIWEFVLAFFRVQGKATVIDDNMKSYLWARLLRKRCLRVWAQDRGDTRLLTQNVENLTSLRSAFGNRLLVTASESSQWLTLTGHPMDSSVARMQFTLLSHISRQRADGLSQVDLTKVSGQDMRSVPQRVKALVGMGLISSFPVVYQKARTVWLVHQRFVDKYLQKAQGGSFGMHARQLNVHSLRLAISNKLASSKNQVKTVRDLIRSLEISLDKNSWALRRFRGQLRALDREGYVQIVLYPKEQAGKFMQCVKLLKPVASEANPESSDQDSEVSGEDEDTDGNDANDLEGPLDLDISCFQLTSSYSLGHSTSMPRGTTVDAHVVEELCRIGNAGRDGRSLRERIVGSDWARPFTEVLRSVSDRNDDPATATSKAIYEVSSRNDVRGKTSHFQYSAEPIDSETTYEPDDTARGLELSKSVNFRAAFASRTAAQPSRMQAEEIGLALRTSASRVAAALKLKLVSQGMPMAKYRVPEDVAEAQIEREHSNSVRTRRNVSKDSPMSRRRAIVLEILKASGGYVCKGAEFTEAFAKKNREILQSDHTTDRKTLYRVMDSLLEQQIIQSEMIIQRPSEAVTSRLSEGDSDPVTLMPGRTSSKIIYRLPGVDLASEEYIAFKQRLFKSEPFKLSTNYRHRELPREDRLEMDIDEVPATLKHRRDLTTAPRRLPARGLHEQDPPVMGSVKETRAPNRKRQAMKNFNAGSTLIRTVGPSESPRVLHPKTKPVKMRRRSEGQIDTQRKVPRRRLQYSSTLIEDDLCVRGAVLSTIFFSRSSSQSNVDWVLVQKLFPSSEETIGRLTRRFSVLKDKPHFSQVVELLNSRVFLLRYNEAVLDGSLEPVPTEPHDGFSLMPYVVFSRTLRNQDASQAAHVKMSDSVEELTRSYSFMTPPEQMIHLRTDYGSCSRTSKRDLLEQSSFDQFDRADEPVIGEQSSRVQGRIRQILMADQNDGMSKKCADLLRHEADEAVVESAVHDLEALSVLTSTRNAVGSSQWPGRPFDLSERYKSAFDVPMLDTMRAATRFEELLNAGASSNTATEYIKSASDGMTAAAVELSEASRATIDPVSELDSEMAIEPTLAPRLCGSEAQLAELKLLVHPRTMHQTNMYDRTGHDLEDGPLFWIDIHGNVSRLRYQQALAVLQTQFMAYGPLSPAAAKERCHPQLFAHEVQHLIESMLAARLLIQWDTLLVPARRFHKVLGGISSQD